MRTPAHTGTGSGGRHSLVRRGGITAPEPMRRSRSGASASSGPSCATGRPPTVTTTRSPPSATRTDSASVARNSRMPIDLTEYVSTCVHKQSCSVGCNPAMIGP